MHKHRKQPPQGCCSAPSSPHRYPEYCRNTDMLQVDFEHLSRQVSLLQAEVEKKSNKISILQAAISKSDERLVSARRSNQDLAKTLAAVLEKMHKANTERDAFEQEATLAKQKIAELEAKLHPDDIPTSDTKHRGEEMLVEIPAVSSSIPIYSTMNDNDVQRAINTDDCINVPQFIPPLQNIPINTFNNHRLQHHQPTSPRSSYSSPSKHKINSSNTLGRIRYGDITEFCELRDAYNSVIDASIASEDPISRWVRNVMSNQSAINADPKEIENMVERLKHVCAENGIILPLKKIGACSYQLGKGKKFLARLINGRLMIRSGPSCIDIFQWLERQLVMDC